MAARLVGSRSWNSVARAFRSDMIYEDKPQAMGGGGGGRHGMCVCTVSNGTICEWCELPHGREVRDFTTVV